MQFKSQFRKHALDVSDNESTLFAAMRLVRHPTLINLPGSRYNTKDI
jgi:hypothetical protein